MKKKAIFFDRDGVVNYRIVKEYITKPVHFRFLPDFLDFFNALSNTSYLRILVTNQQGIGKGLMTEGDLSEVHAFMQNELLTRFGSKFNDIFYCPDLASTNSFYRKPNPGMLLDAMRKWNIEPTYSWMIGDRRSDILAGKNAGIKSILIGNKNCDDAPEADYIFKNLYIAKRFFENAGIIFGEKS